MDNPRTFQGFDFAMKKRFSRKDKKTGETKEYGEPVYCGVREIPLQLMMDFISEYHPEDKHDFKLNAYTYQTTKKNNKKVLKYSHLSAARWFYKRYYPEYIYEKEPDGPRVSEALKDW